MSKTRKHEKLDAQAARKADQPEPKQRNIIATMRKVPDPDFYIDEAYYPWETQPPAQ